MAVSPIMKAFQIFSGLGAVSITPFAHSFFKEREEIKLPNKSDRQVTDDHRKEEPIKVIKEQESTKSAMQRAVQIIESKEGNKEGEKRCFWLFGGSRWLELFMCFNTTTPKPLTLFHYVWRSQELNEVSEITYNGTSSLKMTFDNRRTIDVPHRLWASFAWFRRGHNASFIPRTHCSIKPVEGSQKYELTCQVGDKKYSETVSPEIPKERQDTGLLNS